MNYHTVYSEDFEWTYSLFKLGDRAALQKFIAEVSDLIRQEIPAVSAKTHSVYVTNRYPLNKICGKGSFQLAQGVAKTLKLPLLIGKYHYTSRTQRVDPVIREPYERKHVILIDDSVYEKSSANYALRGLKKKRSVTFFGILKGSHKDRELGLNNLVFKTEGTHKLAEIIRQREYVFTNQMLKTVMKLSPSRRNRISRRIGRRLSRMMNEALKIHLDSL